MRRRRTRTGGALAALAFTALLADVGGLSRAKRPQPRRLSPGALAPPPVAGQRPGGPAGDRQPSYSHPRPAPRSHWLSPRGVRLALSVGSLRRVLIGESPSGHAASLSHTIPPACSASCGPAAGRGLAAGSSDWRRELPLRARPQPRRRGCLKAPGVFPGAWNG